MYTALSISYGDMGTDVAVGVQLLNSAHPEQGIVAFCVLGFMLAMQALAALFFGQGPEAAVAGLFGGKPLYDTYHSVAETPRRHGQTHDYDSVLLMTHMFEVSLKSVPLGLYTAALLVQASADERSAVQMLSVLASVLAIAYVCKTPCALLSRTTTTHTPLYASEPRQPLTRARPTLGS